MAIFKVHKVTALPGTLEPNAFYFVAPPAKPNYVELYVTSQDATATKRILNDVDVQAMIDATVQSTNAIEVVADIAARDALTPTKNITVLVLDASADPTVASGAATYVYRQSDSTWHKISEAESMDVVLQWSNIVGGPTSTPAQIDAAVANSHTHANKTHLDQIGQDVDGELTYAGSNIAPRLETVGW